MLESSALMRNDERLLAFRQPDKRFRITMHLDQIFRASHYGIWPLTSRRVRRVSTHRMGVRDGSMTDSLTIARICCVLSTWRCRKASTTQGHKQGDERRIPRRVTGYSTAVLCFSQCIPPPIHS